MCCRAVPCPSGANHWICDTCPSQGPATLRAVLAVPLVPCAAILSPCWSQCCHVCLLCPISVLSPPLCVLPSRVSCVSHGPPSLCPLCATIAVPCTCRQCQCHPRVAILVPCPLCASIPALHVHCARLAVSPTLSRVPHVLVHPPCPSLLPRVPIPASPPRFRMLPIISPSLPASPPLSPCPRPAMAPLADLYQVSMAYGHWRAGRHRVPAAAELFFRRPPFRGSFALGAGLAEGLRALRAFRFSAAGAWGQWGQEGGPSRWDLEG